MAELIKRQNETPPQALARILAAGRKQVEAAVGDAMSPEFMIRLAVTAVYNSTDLQECSMESIVNSVMLAAQLRLEVNTSLGHAYLIPYKRVCTFQPGYRGLIELAHRSNEVHDVGAHLVYVNDDFELEYGDNPHCIHRPALQRRGDWIGAYARIRYKQGPPSVLYMSREEIEEIRDKCSQSYNSERHSAASPWKRFEAEMIRKTPTKRHLKYCRLTIADLSRAIGLDDEAEVEPTNGQQPDYRPQIAQDLAIEGEVLEMAQEATHELRGSAEKRQTVATEKLANMQAKPAPPTEQRDFTDAENKKLDEDIARQDAEREKQQQKPAQQGKRRLQF
jgi:recombination protein RecT